MKYDKRGYELEKNEIEKVCIKEKSENERKNL